MDGEDEPHLRIRIISIGLILLILSLSTAGATLTPKSTPVKPVIKKETPKLITGFFKPSVRSKYKYKWYKVTWKNQCPYQKCKNHPNTLRMNPKGVPERELTCKRCGADFCGVTGWAKNGRFNRRITRG